MIVCYIYSHAKSLDADQIVRVRQWFWRSAFSERYRGASEHYVSKDLEYIHAFVVNGTGKPETFGPIPSRDLWSTVIFRSNNSRSRAFILALALRGPRNLTNGVAIDTANALSIYNQKEFHHVYPRAYLKSISAPGDHNALANFCILTASENKAISDRDPNIYLPACIARLGPEAAPTFASNLLPAPDAFPYLTATFAEFVEARTVIIDLICSRL